MSEPTAKAMAVADYQPPATHPSKRHEELAAQLHRLGLTRQIAHLDGNAEEVAKIDAEMLPLYAEYDKPAETEAKTEA